jgi:subtilisin-like proprotein convertase family protein
MMRSPAAAASRLGLILAVAVLGAALLAPALEAGVPGGGGAGYRFFETRSARSIPDAPNGGGVLLKIRVRASGRIGDIETSVRITHTFDADLNLYLISPQGKFVELSTDNGGSGNNYGTGPNVCARGTVFDDEARRSIRAGAPPFAGIYRPQTPLRALDGDPIRGVWRLMVFDDDAGSTGTIGCFAMLAVLR